MRPIVWWHVRDEAKNWAAFLFWVFVLLPILGIAIYDLLLW